LIIYSENQNQGLCRGCSDGNGELIVGDDVFQLGELVDPYRVALSNDLEENLNFHIVENIFVDVGVGVDAEELNDILISSRHTKVNEDDNDEINIEDCDEDKDESIDEEEDYSN
jgi:hypothetical protein